MRSIVWLLLAALLGVGVTLAAQAADSTPGLYDRPVLSLDPGMHTARLWRADVDRDGRHAVTASEDKTVRVWSVADGRLQRTIRLPAGPGHIGKVYAVAISPDGTMIAASGCTADGEKQQIYLFDPANGTMTQRIDGLPGTVKHLAFSPDGGRLAAVLENGWGLRVYARDGAGRWSQTAGDDAYGDSSYGVAFAADGRLATTSDDGRLRLYDADGHLLLLPVQTPHAKPYDLAFNPVDGRLAVGFVDSTEVLIYDGATLEPLPSPDVSGIDSGNLGSVAWSADGRVLLAAGRYDDGRGNPVIAWDAGGAGPRRVLRAGSDTVMSLRPLPGGALLVAAADPWLGVIGADDEPRWSQEPRQIDPRRRNNLAVSSDGTRVAFGLRFAAEDRLSFDVGSLELRPPPGDTRVAPPRQNTLAITGWEDAFAPTLDGAPLQLGRNETSRGLAIHPDGSRFLLGADWSLRAFDRAGAELWKRPVPGVAWAVNISGDGRLAVAAYGDGTIRWHRMDNGDELLALFAFADGERWVLWTPEGYYAASPGAAEALGWVVNRGPDKAADFFPVSAFPGFYEPGALAHVPETMDTPKALGMAKIGRDRKYVQDTVDSPAPPGPQLHVLTIGVSRYAGDRPKPLDFADDDATGLARALLKQGGGLYAKVNLEGPLTDDRATLAGILEALRAMERRMKPDQQDVAVVLFSGHGTRVDGDYYLLPNDVDAGSEVGIETTALDIDKLIKVVGRMGEKGKVLVLLDACHSGAVADGIKQAAPPDIADVREALAAAGNGVIVLSSSSGSEVSREDPDWGNGAFTEAVLESLDGRADRDGNGYLSVSELEGYVVGRVRELTDNAQNPTVTAPGGRHYLAELFRTGL